jgi:ribonuclease HII
MPKQPSSPKRFRYELALVQQGLTLIAGVDEAGRGPLAGPVFAAAAILPAEWVLKGLPKALRKINDSKQLSAELREELYLEITSRPEICFAVAQVDSEMIDRINILQATHRAMNLALAQLTTTPEHVLVDGLAVKSLKFANTPIVGGDGRSYSIGAASILAKVSRDRLMIELDKQYPGYHFAEHKGYGTPDHLAAIRQRGPCPIHRQTFSPFRPVQNEFASF